MSDFTLKDFRDQTRHLPPGTLMGLSHDEHFGHDVIVLRAPDSKGMENIVNCGELEAVGKEGGMKGSFHITYEWWVTETPDDSIPDTEIHNADIHPEHVDELHKLARDRAIEMIDDSYTGGELLADLNSEDGPLSYKGWWDLKKDAEPKLDAEDEDLSRVRWEVLEGATP